ncbi:MAG: hypothetical protein AAGA85_22240, partial [Bacteroidota bacterium]
MQVIALALERRVRVNRDRKVKMSCRSTTTNYSFVLYLQRIAAQGGDNGTLVEAPGYGQFPEAQAF